MLKIKYNKTPFMRPGGGIGRHKGLKIPRQQWRAGSSPAPGTSSDIDNYVFNLY